MSKFEPDSSIRTVEKERHGGSPTCHMFRSPATVDHLSVLSLVFRRDCNRRDCNRYLGTHSRLWKLDDSDDGIDVASSMLGSLHAS